MSSKARRRVKLKRREVPALQILEEAFHLARSADLKGYWYYALGMVPWSVGLLYFLADMSRSSLAVRDAALSALVMTLLWLWVRYTQARFCEGLWERLNPGGLPPAGRRERFRSLCAMWLLQAFQLPLLAAGFFFAVPLGWVIAFLENLPALALTRAPSPRPLRDLARRALRNCHEQWAQNHLILLVFFFVTLFTWVNLVASCILVPSMVKAIFGIESVFTLNPSASLGNTTFIGGSFLLTQLVLGPLWHATYVLRCFYAESRASGADLLSRLASVRAAREVEERRERGALGRVALVALGLVLAGAASPAGAEEARPTRPALREGADPDRLRAEIEETLEDKKYQWQLSRREQKETNDEEKSWLALRLEEFTESLKDFAEKGRDWLFKRLKEYFDRKMPARSESDGGEFLKSIGSVLSIALVVIAVGLLAWVGWLIYRHQRGREKKSETVNGGGTAVDLSSEDVVATQLHEDEWLKLARDQIDRGDSRLAIRALYLATLAHLGEKGLLRIVRSKSNRDYRRELERRARSLPALLEAFGTNTRLYERGWYGLHEIASSDLDTYLENHGQIVKDSASAQALVAAKPIPA